MDKLLKVDFWKKLKFPSKSDGLAFLHTQTDLLNLHADLDLKLQNHNEQLINTLFNAFNSPDISLAKNTFITQSKLSKKLHKSKKDKDIAKHEAKIELILDDFLDILPPGWQDDPPVHKIYCDLVSSKIIFTLKTSTLENLKLRILHKWEADKLLNDLVLAISQI